MRRHSFALAALCILLELSCNAAGQTTPDIKRVHEIQAALVAHGYKSGKSWEATQATLRTIAAEHGWQTHRAPDARVLIFLGLGNKHSNTDVTLEGKNHLDSEPAKDRHAKVPAR